ncbi:tyrosine-type recombinase/integrase [Phocaeicola dorei]|nr:MULTISPECIES: tyrosine-type recombinase/integrase [Phocaeicola]MDV7062640.1 tyrosine-type recombinase/integrase [Phocaeicola dorei]MDY2675140.1 tyrosine-type recombinase/integrase [Phocaeicola vulgatus]
MIHNNQQEARLYCRITIMGQRYEISLNCTIRKTSWNKDAQKCVGKTETDRIANRSIEDFRIQVQEAIDRVQVKGQELNIENIRLNLYSQENEYNTISRLFDYHEIIDRKNLREGSYRGYIITKKHLLDYVRIKYHVADYDINAIDKPFVQEFFAYLQGYRREGKIRCAVNGALKHITRFKRVMNLALQNEWINRNPVTLLHVKKEHVEKEFLTEQEIKQIEELTLKPHLEIVRDIFLFSVYTGAAYVDVSNLAIGNIRQGIDRSLWLQYSRQKTDQRVSLPLLDPAQCIINKYTTYHNNKLKNKLFPMPTNQEINRHLKTIAKEAGLDKTVTFHCARHTFATTVTLAHGIPIETVSKMLGHAALSTTQIYAKVLDNKIMDDMAALKQLYAVKEKTKKISNQ